ncbi:MAG TPA: Sec-independent protein translocase protein TatB [Xanthobacteraceae bacterium]|nr:Sec-independent protein translocase protein TatB [Xanthobacteraceae bacterium]
MFDISWGELLIIGIVALVVIGPKELPGVLRTVGQWMAKVRRMATEFQDQFREAMREAELEELKKTVEDISSSSTTSDASFDPIGTIRSEFETAVGDPPHIEEPLSGPKSAESTSAVPSPSPSDVAAAPAQSAPSASEPAPSADARKTGDAA